MQLHANTHRNCNTATSWKRRYLTTMRFWRFEQITLCAIAALSLVIGAVGNQNPCHADKTLQGVNVTCAVVAIPTGLCSACKLKPIQPGGHFQDCTSIYDVRAPSCRAKLEEYVALNKHCDPVRAEQVAQIMTSEKARQGIDYFMYSICEQCCDCIPRGTHISQYGFRKSIDKLFNVARGNCPAHAVYDVCKVWPKVRAVIRPGQSREIKAPMVCPHLKVWLRNPENANWLYRNQVKYHAAVGKFLRSFVDVTECGVRPTWDACVRLETMQRRL